MTSSIGGLGSPSASQIKEMFSKIDTDSDGAVTRDEFVSGAPDDVSSEMAGKLFDALDSQGSGSLSESDMASAFEQLSSTMQSTVLQAQSDSSAPAGGPPDPSELFSKLDGDGDGSVSRDEFVAGRPDDMSEDQANAMFDSMAGEDADSIDQDSFVTAMAQNKPPQPPSGGGANELLAAVDSYARAQSGYGSASSVSALSA